MSNALKCGYLVPMGCYIYSFIEFRSSSSVQTAAQFCRRTFGMTGASDVPMDRWKGFAEVELDQDYLLFGLIAGKRRVGPPVVSPRGLPMDLSWLADRKWWLQVIEDGDIKVGLLSSEETARAQALCSIDEARDYQRGGRRLRWSAGNGRVTFEPPSPGLPPQWVEHPDFNTPGWLSSREFAQVLRRYQSESKFAGVTAKATLAAMKALEKDKFESRLVFWFTG